MPSSIVFDSGNQTAEIREGKCLAQSPGGRSLDAWRVAARNKRSNQKKIEINEMYQIQQYTRAFAKANRVNPAQ